MFELPWLKHWADACDEASYGWQGVTYFLKCVTGSDLICLDYFVQMRRTIGDAVGRLGVTGTRLYVVFDKVVLFVSKHHTCR
jgi:hypothetical protein